MSTYRQRAIRDRMFRDHPFCYWCGVRLSHPSEHVNGKAPYHMATLDHLDSAYCLRPMLGCGKHDRFTVLACRECNSYRNTLEQQGLPPAELWRRAGNYEKAMVA